MILSYNFYLKDYLHLTPKEQAIGTLMIIAYYLVQ